MFSVTPIFFQINMAPKKSAFITFLTCYRDDEIKNGKKPSSYDQLRNKLSPIWNVSNL